ncbi:hypothetical protein N7470_003685 [Penicillium chermesinum]|nr:hypothetical protein N7470_003685 [Penicillium chermesinum]
MILALIRNLNSRASCGFQIESLDIAQMDRRNHVVLCLPVVNYGQRNHHSHDAVPSGLTQADKYRTTLWRPLLDGYSIMLLDFNIACLVKLDNKRLFDRWSAWGHITINDIAGFFKTMNLGPDAYHDYLFPHRKLNGMINKLMTRQPSKPNPVIFPAHLKYLQSPGRLLKAAIPRFHLRDPRKANRKT